MCQFWLQDLKMKALKRKKKKQNKKNWQQNPLQYSYKHIVIYIKKNKALHTVSNLLPTKWPVIGSCLHSFLLQLHCLLMCNSVHYSITVFCCFFMFVSICWHYSYKRFLNHYKNHTFSLLDCWIHPIKKTKQKKHVNGHLAASIKTGMKFWPRPTVQLHSSGLKWVLKLPTCTSSPLLEEDWLRGISTPRERMHR